jgi:drug/metabolite transporter (DMT)-like permease
LAVAGVLTGLAQFSLWTALQQGSPAVVSPFQYSQLLWATFYGLVLFGAVPDPMTLAGAVLVIGSGLYIMHRERVLRHRESA